MKETEKDVGKVEEDEATKRGKSRRKLTAMMRMLVVAGERIEVSASLVVSLLCLALLGYLAAS